MRSLCVGKPIAAVFALLATGVPALATHVTPYKAVQLKGEFLTAYEPCDSPNTSTSNVFPGCMPPVRSDSTCGFSSRGKGKFLMRYLPTGPDRLVGTSDDGDILLQADVVGLEPACQGVTLVMSASMRVTLDDCGGVACSVMELPDYLLAACTVDSVGRCQIKTTVNGAARSQLCLNGRRTNVAIRDVSLFHGVVRTLTAGVLIE